MLLDFTSFLFAPLVVVGIIVMGVLALSFGRTEPDPHSTRPYAVYLVSVTFVALFLALFSAFGARGDHSTVGLRGSTGR